MFSSDHNDYFLPATTQSTWFGARAGDAPAELDAGQL